MAIQLKEALSKFFDFKDDWRILLFENWDKIVGGLEKYTSIDKIQDDTLFLGVYESVWMQELFLLSDGIVTSINTFLGSEKIKNIKLRLISKKSIELAKELKSEFKMTYSPINLTETQKLALDNIQDEELKKLLVDFLEKVCKK